MYKEGPDDVRNNAIRGKQYGFQFSSKCFRALLEYLYTGQISSAPLSTCSACVALCSSTEQHELLLEQQLQ